MDLSQKTAKIQLKLKTQLIRGKSLNLSETVKVETFEQNIDEYPIHINMSGSVDDVNKFTEGLALSFDLTKAEETSNVSIIFQELNSDGSVATETIEGVDLPDARLASTARGRNRQ